MRISVAADWSQVDSIGYNLFSDAYEKPDVFYDIRSIHRNYVAWFSGVLSHVTSVFEVGPGKYSAVALALRTLRIENRVFYTAIEKRWEQAQYLKQFLGSTGSPNFDISVAEFKGTETLGRLPRKDGCTVVCFEHSIDDLVIDSLVGAGYAARDWPTTLQRFDAEGEDWYERAQRILDRAVGNLGNSVEVGLTVLVHHYCGGPRKAKSFLLDQLIIGKLQSMCQVPWVPLPLVKKGPFIAECAVCGGLAA